MGFSHFLGALLGALLLLMPARAQLTAAPYDPSQFSLLGTITGMTLNIGASPLRGGTIVVDGVTVIVPDNTIATLPAAAVAWPELFINPTTPNLPGTQSWTATIFGNRVNDQHIAGLVYIAQNPVKLMTGFITSIDSTTGHFTVDGPFSPAGTLTCVINDPLGVYGPVYTANPLWSVDPVNPSVHAFTGFPMCIPRSANDPLCPTKNRPTDPATGRPATKLTFGNPATLKPTDPDPNLMAPLVVGDYITFSGQMVGNIYEVNNLVANLGYYTSPGTKPAYITVDAAAFGITVPARADPPETKATVFTTDPTTPIEWFAQDVDPCTGTITERNLQLVQPQSVAPIGRAVFRFGATPVAPPTRNVGFRATTGTTVTGNNLTAGQFIQPIFSFVFPEIVAFGNNVDPYAFDVFPFLAQGSGPYTPGNPLTAPLTNPPIIGQLSPWPGSPVPAATTCAPVVPTTPASTPTPAAPPPPDTVTITSASKVKNRGGSFIITVAATTNNLQATLSVSVAGVTNIGPSPMTNNGNGQFSLVILSKGLPTSVTVTSSAGGKAGPVAI